MLTIDNCGLMLEPQLGMSGVQLITTAKQTEQLGFGYLFRSDHLLPTDNRRGIDSPECWTTLGAIAASTNTLRFGPLVSPVGFRNPALLARMACTLHALSSGRLQVALGAGWYRDEYYAHGFEFPTFKVRKAQFVEALTIVLSMVRDGRVDFDGKFFSAHTDCNPRPSGPVHVIIGGRTKGVVKIAASKADEWNSLVTQPEAYPERKALLEQLSDGRKVEISEMGPFLLGRNKSELESNASIQLKKLGQTGTPEELIKRIRSRGAFCGTPDEFAVQLTRKLDVGVRKFYFQTLVPENTSMIELLSDTLKSYS